MNLIDLNEKTTLIVCRLGELFLKGRNRSFFTDRLESNIKAVTDSFGGVLVQYVHGRFFITHPEEIREELISRLSKIFGLTSVSPAVRTEKDIHAMQKAAVDLVTQPGVLDGKKSFAVKAHRSDKRFVYKSPEIGRIVGDAVGRAIGLDVDLDNPDLCVEVEVGPHAAFVFSRRVGGAGGLPVGVSGRAVLLLSAGIDSPIAGWMMMKRGISIDALTFHSPPYTDEAALDKVLRNARKIAAWGGDFTLRAVRFADVQKRIHRKAEKGLAVVLYRRMMMRTACKIAQFTRAGAVVTGESLGQVASQTMENMTRIQEASTLPILRPLIGLDKSEIIQIARRLETYEISIEPHIDSCTLFTPKHPVTRASKDLVERAEQRIDMDFNEEAGKLAADAEVFSIKAGENSNTCR